MNFCKLHQFFLALVLRLYRVVVAEYDFFMLLPLKRDGVYFLNKRVNRVNKKKIAVLVATGMLAAPLIVQAEDVEVYGDVRLSIDMSQNEQDPVTGGKDDSALSVNSNTSKLGFKGSEKLSDNLSVIWQYETEVELDNGDLSVKGRDTYGGLKGSWGLLKAGKLSNPMKQSSSKIDIFTNTRADHNMIVGYVNGVNTFDNRFDNTIWYSTPKFGGVKLDLSYTTDSAGSKEDALPGKLISPQKNVTSFSLNYDKGPLYVAIATEARNDAKLKDNGQYEDVAATKLVGRWDFGQGTTVGFIYEDAENSAGAETSTMTLASASGQARTAFYLNAAHKIGNTTLKAAYSQADDLDNMAGTGATHYALGVFKSYSKNTELYLLYTATNNDANAKYGLKDMAGVEGNTISALSFGLNKRFSSK
ncbi:MAG: porin [Gammaproteobacteria bacterium]|nr:porin [Gammaproteobacteria bacterium]